MGTQIGQRSRSSSGDHRVVVDLRGLGDVGRDRVHPDAGATDLEGEAAREVRDRGLVRPVDGVGRVPPDAFHRGDVDDAAGAPLDHRGHEGARAPEHVLHVDLVECEPVLLVGLEEGRRSQVVPDVVHEDVDGSVTEHALGECSDRGGVADVGHDRLGGATGRPDRLDALVGEVGVDVGDDDRAPAAARASETAPPMPPAPPVTTATFPPRSIAVVTSSRSAARAPRSSRASPPRRARTP